MSTQVLVLSCVREGTGPAEKARDLAEGFSQIGCEAEAVVVAPDRRSAPSAMRAVLAECQPDVLVLRSHWTLPLLAPRLRGLRSDGARIVVDIPTPVRAGMSEILGSARSPASKAARGTLEALWSPAAWPVADLLVQYDTDSVPWRRIAPGRRLSLTNAVAVTRRPLAPDWPTRNSVTLVAAGALGHWHGYDRLLRGIAATRRDHSRVRLAVVGEGPELPRLVELAGRLGLTQTGSHASAMPLVHFLGRLEGSAYDDALAGADVGVGSLGEHRRGSHSLSTLKVRDYLARGLPVALAGDDPDLRAGFGPGPGSDLPFLFRIPDDDSPVDIAALTRWLDGLRSRTKIATTEASAIDRSPTSQPVSPLDIRAFATAHLDYRDRAAAILAALE